VDDVIRSITTYVIACAGFLSNLEWSSVLASILVLARLIQEVPKAIRTIRIYKKKWSNHGK